MAELDDRKVDIIIALLAQLVAASTKEDPVLALNAAGLKASEIAPIVGMKPNAVSMRVARNKGGKK